uniref:Hsp70-like protein n=1 Tax=Grapevine leafroll-associated virus 3 TaxID=55951 RepID=A0A2S0M2X0_9CLOS|nr:Hsp70-like protein [Grapevine leafroll-associated virus 3]AXI81990.1 Hsp70-like protein [Grapevine leafroll-associated virus 3]AXI82002.1 Hsp70-like protein [Grapevine leafroll-associated virus 3]AXI82027.1 Hsp70-like protein [Grapevine leafroll-associated virus 3]
MEVGIDFGTTFSTICFSPSGVAGCTPVAGSVFVETQIFVPQGSSTYFIGKAAGKAYREGAAGRLYVNPKRWVGVTRDNIERYVEKLKPTYTVKIDSGGALLMGGLGSGPDVLLRVVDVICLFLKALVLECERQTSSTITAAVVTVPADYNSFKRSFVVEALKGLGIPVRGVVNEPTAAALFSLAKSKVEDLLLAVFDFGGGTFDVSFVKKKGDVLCVIFSVGDNFLGGRDIDRAVVEVVKTKIKGRLSDAKLGIFVSSIKEELSNNSAITQHLIPVEGGVEVVDLTSEELDAIVAPFSERAIEVFKTGLSNFYPDPVIAVMTGGSSALSRVRKDVAALPQISKVVYDSNDFRCSVACGAKVYCDILAGSSSLRLVDTLTNTLTDEVSDFTPVVIFPKGSPIPCTYTHTYDVSGGDVIYGIFEGENNRAFLNEPTFRGISKHRGEPKEKDVAQFSLSTDGTVSLVVNGVEVKNEYLVPGTTDVLNSLTYKSGRDELEAKAIPEYLTTLNVLHAKTLTRKNLDVRDKVFSSLKIEENFVKSKGDPPAILDG